tara:strand:+ start:404 stop:805 length:402 start_codon:yes stop_codon:yes gene_type:complete
LALEGQASHGENDGSGLPSLSSEFMSGACAHTAAQSCQQYDKFGFLEKLVCERAQAAHALLRQRWKSGATHAVQSMPKPKDVDVFTGLEAGVIGIDEHEVRTAKAFLMCLVSPRTTDAPHSSNENVGWVHEGH